MTIVYCPMSLIQNSHFIILRDFPFADLLSPHGIIKTFQVEQFLVFALFDDPAFFKDVDFIGVHNGGQSVGNEDCDVVAAAG